MNKKLLSSCLALSIFFIAMAPISKQSNVNSSNTVHSTTEWQQLNLEKVSSARQKLLNTDGTVTYPQDEKIVISEAAKVKDLASRGESTAKRTSTRTKSTASKSTSNSAIKVTTKATTTVSKVAARPVRTATSTKTTTASTTSRSTATISTVSSSKASAVISTAKSFMGVPYVWGGTTPSGFDCSGFTQYVLGENGISVPRTAAEQYTVGTIVSKSNLRVGDLVFFTTYKAGASHLGFYIGDGNFIHASSSKGVTISSLNSTYYASHYIGARRVID